MSFDLEGLANVSEIHVKITGVKYRYSVPFGQISVTVVTINIWIHLTEEMEKMFHESNTVVDVTH